MFYRREFEQAIVEIQKYVFYSPNYGNSVPLEYVKKVLGEMIVVEPIFPKSDDEITNCLIEWTKAESEAERMRCGSMAAARKLINVLMDKREQSLRQLAESLECSASYLSKVERGKSEYLPKWRRN